MVRFDGFEFDPSTRELRKGRTRLRVPDQSLIILAMLLERPGEVVTREAVQARLWPNGTVVEFEHSVNSAMKRLRQVLLDTASSPRFIETLPRRGYRFVGTIEPEGGLLSKSPRVQASEGAAGSITGTVEHPLRLSVGATLGRYEILALLGAGGMGEVYKARDTRLDRIVAIKQLKGNHSNRFEQEARAIGALNHPNICQIHDVGSDYLVLEYIEGHSPRCPCSPEEALHLASQIAGALEAAHSKGIIHRDLKPANILVTEDGTVKLLDFGIAKLRTTSGGEVTRTIEGTLLGTAGYMAPEQVEGKRLDHRSDIFSFGAVLYEMLSGNRAFSGSSPAHLLSSVLRDDPPPLQASPALERIVMRCLEKAPENRFQSAAELKAALSRISLQREERPSVAVLPFANMSRDPDDEYFSDGLAEEIINELAQIPGLKVIARTSAFAFKGQNADVRDIARALGVNAILEGSVRRSGNRIRVSAQLITAADGSHLWSQRFDRELADVFAIQDEIAQAIALSLQVKLGTTASIHRPYAPGLPAYEAFLRGRHYLFKFTPESWSRAEGYFLQAISLDPLYAQPHASLGFGYLLAAINGFQNLPAVVAMIRAAAQAALRINPSEPEPRFLLGSVAAAHDYDWEEAARQFQAAVGTTGVPGEVRWAYASLYLQPLGRFREAVNEMRLAVEQDPLNVTWRAIRSSHLVHAGMADQAIVEAHSTLEIDENHWVTHFVLVEAYLAKGMIAEALTEAERAYQAAPWHTSNLGMLAGLLVRTGEKTRAAELLRQMGDAPTAAFGRVLYHLICSEIDEAADWYEKSIEKREQFAIVFALAPISRELRRSPRWPRLAKLMNIAEKAAHVTKT